MINWSGISNKTMSGKLLRFPLRLIPKNLWVPILQGPLKGMRWMSGSGNAGCWLGSYELANQHALQRFIKPGMTVFVIGAHVVFYTLLFSKLTGPTGNVCAFEPFASNIVYLLQHVHANKCTNVNIYQLAISDRDLVTQFTPGDINRNYSCQSEPPRSVLCASLHVR
jgi:hypothetical protein